MSQFSPASARALVGPPWLAERRAAAAETFLSRPAPTEKDEVWRYSRIDRLDLDRYRPVAAPEGRPVGTVPAGLRELADALGPRSALVVTVDGSLVAVEDAVGHAAAVRPWPRIASSATATPASCSGRSSPIRGTSSC